MLHPRRLIVIAILGLAAGLAPRAAAQGDAPQGVAWRADFEAGLEEAVLKRRPVLVTFYTTWCGWCRKLDRTTFRDPDFVDTAERFVPVRVDGDKERGLAAMFRVTGYPTTVVLSRRGRELQRIVGYRPPAEFTGALLAAMGQREPFEDVTSRAEMHPEDAEAQYDLGDMFLALGRFPEAAEAFKRVLDLDTTNASGYADDAQLDMALSVYLSGRLEGALPLFEAFHARFPQSDRRDQALYFHGLALLDAGREGEGRSTLERAARETTLAYIKAETDRILGHE